MKKISFILLVLLLSVSCEKDADIEIDEMAPVPVIEGKFSNIASGSFFKITMSKGFHRDDYEYHPVTDAQLSITDSQGNTIMFAPDSEGIYRTTSNGVPGETYTLTLIKDSHRVTAQSTMPSLVPITDFEFITETGSNGETENKLKLYFNDPEDRNDYYMVQIFYNDSSGFYQLASGIYFNDNTYDKATHSISVSFVYYSGPGAYKVKLFHLNKAYVDYLNTLNRLGGMGYGDSPFQIFVPGNPETNVEGGIGYFATVAVDTLVKTVN